jgi:hypothetical protein
VTNFQDRILHLPSSKLRKFFVFSEVPYERFLTAEKSNIFLNALKKKLPMQGKRFPLEQNQEILSAIFQKFYLCTFFNGPIVQRIE